MTTWRWTLVVLAVLAILVTALTAVIDIDSALFLPERNLSTGQLLSSNWWHPIVRLAAIWLWLAFIVGALATGVVWLAGRLQREAES